MVNFQSLQLALEWKMGLSVWQIALVALIFILLFGRGKIPALMSDLASGIKNFKQGIKEEDQQLGGDAESSSTLTDKVNKS